MLGGEQSQGWCVIGGFTFVRVHAKHAGLLHTVHPVTVQPLLLSGVLNALDIRM